MAHAIHQLVPGGKDEYPRKGIAARAGAWSAAHRKTAILGWLAFVVVALIGAGSVGTNELTGSDGMPGEAGTAQRALEDSGLSPASEVVLVQSDELTVDDPQFAGTVDDLTSALGKIDAVGSVSSPLRPGGTVSEDGHSALVEFAVKGDPDKALDKIDPVIEAVDGVAAEHPQLRVEQFGDASAEKALEAVFSEDLAKAEHLSLPLTLLILVVAFGSLVAAGVPLLIGISAVMAAFGLVALPSQLFPVDQNLASVILLIGLAVGVDYSLFYMRREREERAAGRSPREALQAAAATSGRAILISGLTVIAAMSGLLLAGDATFTSFGIGTMIVVASAMVASLTVLPAILAWLGDRVEKGRLPFVGRRRRTTASRGTRVWTAITDRVLRRPVLSLVLAGGAMVALAVPALGMKMDVAGPDTLPRDIAIVQTYDRVQEAFPGDQIPATVVVEASDVRAADVQGAISSLREQAKDTEGLLGADRAVYSQDGTVAEVAIPIAGDGNDAASKQALDTLREETIPAAFGGVDATVSVGGQTADSVDFTDQMVQRLPLVIGFVLTLAFGLMLITFRSVVIPIKAIALNLLSVAASYGVLVLVFQHGLGHDLLGFETPGAIAAWLPLFLFVVLFGLSMDYHVFILSRVREGVEAGMSTDEAVRAGISQTAGTVTSAAVVMVGVFAIFASLTILDMKEMGIGLGVAILLDATVVRGVLLPASMKLLGKWNWYLPRSLGWLPRVRGESPVELEPAGS